MISVLGREGIVVWINDRRVMPNWYAGPPAAKAGITAGIAVGVAVGASAARAASRGGLISGC